jgi:hypothetical protein
LVPHVAKICVVRIFGAGRKIDGAECGGEFKWRHFAGEVILLCVLDQA